MKKSFWLFLLVFSLFLGLNSFSTDDGEKEKTVSSEVETVTAVVDKIIVSTKQELKGLIYQRMQDAGYKGKAGDPGTDIDLNDIDISNLKELDGLFSNINSYPSPYLNHFNGDISNWKVDNVTNMQRMFSYSQFNQDISNWNFDKVTNMRFMFNSATNFDNGGKPDGLDKWRIAPNVNKSGMFDSSKLQSDNNIPCWDDGDLSDCPNP